MYQQKESWTQIPQNAKTGCNSDNIVEEQPVRYQEMVTAVKKTQEKPIFTQDTARPNRKIMLFDEEKNRRLFPLIRDRDVGMGSQFENLVIESYNDDDKQTSSTQMRAGMIQTLQDLYGEVEMSEKR